MTKPIGWRTSTWTIYPQPNITIEYEDGATWHRSRGGLEHLEDFQPLPDDTTWMGSPVPDGLWSCSGCGFLVEPIYAEEEHPEEEYMKLLEIVKALANGGPPTDSDSGLCVMCRGYKSPQKDQASHDVDCPWRMAKEALA